MVEARRTAVVKLETSPDERDVLRETSAQFNDCANATAEWCWHGDDGYHVTNKRTARDALYRELKDGHDLTANLVQASITRTVEAIKSGVAKLKRGERTSRPHFTAPSIVYDKRAATFYRNKVSLSTVDGRIELPFVLPSGSPTPYEQYVLSEEYEFRTSTVQRHDDGEWYIHLSTRRYDPENEPGNDSTEVASDETTENGSVLGVDLGVRHIAVASTGRFWSTSEFNHWKREYERRRASMQQVGTRHAHEAMQSVGRKEEGRFTIFLHRVANELVTEARETGCTVIAFEDLTHIRERLSAATWQHVWAFRRLYEYVEYKAADYSIDVQQVPPENTSRRCSTCGFTHEDNRDGECFQCGKCGYQNHADYNAAKNIGFRYLRRRQKGGDGGAPVDVRLNRGTLNVSGAFTLRRLIPSRPERESTRKPHPQGARPSGRASRVG